MRTPEQRERQKVYDAKYYAAHREKRNAQSAADYVANREKRKAQSAAYVAAHREKTNARKKAWNRAHPEKARARAAKWRRANPEKARRRRGRPEPTRPAPQNCELCSRPGGKIAFALDHCHTTGLFRGWLCRNCNLGLGLFKDDLVLLRKAAQYLENFRAAN